MKRVFRKYHRTLAVILCLPIALTVITGILASVIQSWTFVDTGLSSNLILRIHTGEIFHLEAIYPTLNGLGLIGLLVTGMSMTRLFKGDRPQSSDR